MKPLFFPFTHVTQEDRRAMLTCFKGFSHLSVSRPNEFVPGEIMPKDPTVEVLHPSDQEVASALAVVEDYRQWASVNRGRAGQLKTRVPDAPYFTSDTGIATLKSTIERGAVSEAEANSESPGSEAIKLQKAFLKALVFLRMSQESDRENDQINRGFKSIRKREAALFSALKGNDLSLTDNLEGSSINGLADNLLDNNQGVPVDHQNQVIDRGAIMTEQKILAWGCFFRKKMENSNLDANFLPVTTSPAVLDYFKSTAKKSTKVLDIANFKVHEGSCNQPNPSDSWKCLLSRTIENAVLGKGLDGKKLVEEDDGCALLADIQLYLFLGRELTDIFYPLDQKGIKNRLIQGEGGEIPICLVHVKK